MKDELLFQDNFFVSKSMKQIDSGMGYKGGIQDRLIKNLIEVNKDKSKDFSNEAENENELINLKKKIKEEEIRKREISRNNTYQLNLISSQYNLQFLPKISPYIKNVDNYLIMDFKKAYKLGSKGFEYIWKQDNLRKLSNVKKDSTKNKKTKSKSISYKKENTNINDNNEDEEKIDIFNKKYYYEEKKCVEFTKLKDRLNRIIKQNKKVKEVFDFQKALSLKFQVKKIYYPKYESIEKHKPEIRLNNKTRRIFIDDFIKKSYYLNNNKMSSTSINNNLFKDKKFISRTTTNKRKPLYICSSFDNIFSQTNKPNGFNNFSDVNNNMKYTNIKFYPKENSLLGINKND